MSRKNDQINSIDIQAYFHILKNQEAAAGRQPQGDRLLKQCQAMTRGIRLDNIEAMLFDFEGTLVDFQWKLSAAIEETLEMLWNIGFAKDRD